MALKNQKDADNPPHLRCCELLGARTEQSKNILKVGQNFQISYGPQRITVIMVDVLLQFQLLIILSMVLNQFHCI